MFESQCRFRDVAIDLAMEAIDMRLPAEYG